MLTWPDFEVLLGLLGNILKLVCTAVSVISHGVQDLLLALQFVVHLLQGGMRASSVKYLETLRQIHTFHTSAAA